MAHGMNDDFGPRDFMEHQIWIRRGDDASETRFISADTEMRVAQQEISDLTNAGLKAPRPQPLSSSARPTP